MPGFNYPKWLREKFWPWFKKTIWPEINRAIKNLFRDLLERFTRDVVHFITEQNTKRVSEAQRQANAAARKAEAAKDKNEARDWRARAEVWREWGEKLKKDNESLRAKLVNLEAQTTSEFDNALGSLTMPETPVAGKDGPSESQAAEGQAFLAARKVFTLYSAFFKAVANELGPERALALHAAAHAEQGAAAAQVIKQRLGDVPADIGKLGAILKESNLSIGINSELAQASTSSALFRNLQCPMYEGYRIGGLDDKTAEALCQKGAAAKLGTMLKEIDPRISYQLKYYRSKHDEPCEEQVSYVDIADEEDDGENSTDVDAYPDPGRWRRFIWEAGDIEFIPPVKGDGGETPPEKEAKRIGVLLTEDTSEKPVILIEFDPLGALRYASFDESLEYHALIDVEQALKNHWLKEPLYIKYADALKREPELPPSILAEEAQSAADNLNRLRPLLVVGNWAVLATVVRFRMSWEERSVWLAHTGLELPMIKTYGGGDLAQEVFSPEPTRVPLYEGQDDMRRNIYAEVDRGGNLAIIGKDSKKASPQPESGDEYEFGVSIKAEVKDLVLLSLIRREFGGTADAVDEFHDYVTSQGVPSRFSHHP